MIVRGALDDLALPAARMRRVSTIQDVRQVDVAKALNRELGATVTDRQIVVAHAR